MNEKDRREPLFQHLDTVLKVSEKKFKADKRENSERIRWGGLIVRAVQAYGKLLETTQLDELAKDIEEIKKKVGIN